MTKEETVYAATLNLLGSDILDPGHDYVLADLLGCERRKAAHSTGPHADCPRCYWTVPFGGPSDGEHYADLWEHLITRHGIDTWVVDGTAQYAWERAAETYEGAKAA